MADSLVSTALEKLKLIIEGEVKLLVGVPNEIGKLSTAFTSIQHVLVDAESRRVEDRDVKIWLEKVKDVAYDMDDILDEWTAEALISQAADEGDAPDEGDGSCLSFLVTCFLSLDTCFNHVVLRHKIGNRIKKVMVRLDEIEKEKNKLGLKVDSGESKKVDREVREGEIRERETSSQLDRQSMVGRVHEKYKILDLLLSERSGEVNEVPFVISIVGMGGLGKTTLAQLVYNDKKVYDEEVKGGHFHERMWVCVSDVFDVKQITKSIIKSVDKSNCDHLSLDQLQHHLRDMLRRKRFLLVLDDVWSKDSKKWKKLKLPFLDGALGSRIVITTRSEDVASAVRSAHVHKLAVLSDDECWLLFRREAFRDRSEDDRRELEDIGKEIVKRCGGLPLAAETIGSAMHSRPRSQWEHVLKSDVWKSADVLPALLLSYHDLPLELKQCFMYFSMFPKDWKMQKDVIVKLWVAQGFIRCGESGDMEEIGGLYFDDLLRRSLLQVAELDHMRNIVGYKMHDLVHDLAQSVAGTECSVVDVRKPASMNLNNARHSFFIGNAEGRVEVASIWATLHKAHKLRTLLLKSSISKVPENLFLYWLHLRALDLSHTRIEELPRKVEQLKQLRYLNLSNTLINELPEEVCNCINLQTLLLNGCDELTKLPRGMRKMISLRHLEFNAARYQRLRYLPQGIGRLTALRTLTVFYVGDRDEKCKCRELKHLNHLQGSLRIFGLENVRSWEEAMEAELYKKRHLNALSLGYENLNGELLDDDQVKMADGVLEILQPYKNLKKLEISGYRGSKYPKWIENPKFSNLVDVMLYKCYKCEQLPGLGKLPYLQHLSIWYMMEVKKVGAEFSGEDNNDGSGGGGVSFPKLESLHFHNMPNWEEWELRGGDGQVMPSLRVLGIYECPKLKALPCKLTVFEDLNIEGCPVLEERCRDGGEDWDKIAHIPSIRI